MGIADRDYHRHDHREGGGLFSQLTPVVKWLLILNLGIFFLDIVMKGRMDLLGPLSQLGAYTIQSAIFEGQIWQFLTFQFLHADFGHVLFNCFGLFFFGPWMERWWGSGKFLIFYLLCGAAGAGFYTLLAMSGLLPGNGGLVGASAGIYGILIGVAVIAPHMRVQLLLPPIELSMRQLALAILAIAAGTILFKFRNAGGEAGHLGGAILGFLLVRHPNLLGRDRGVAVFRPKRSINHPAPKLRPRTKFDRNQDSAVDLILDKISRDGFQSLTQAEKDLLQKASESKRSS